MKMSPIGTGIVKKIMPTRKPQIAGALSPIPGDPNLWEVTSVFYAVA